MSPDLYKILYSSLILLASIVCWYYWKYVYPFRNFASCHYEARFFFNFVTGKYFKPDGFLAIIFQEILDRCKAFHKDGLYVIWFFRPLVIVFNPEYTKILSNNPGTANKPAYYKIMTELLKGTLIDSNGPVWREGRKLLGHAFQNEVFKTQLSTVNRNAHTFIRRLSELTNKPNADIYPCLQEAILKTACETACGIQLSSKDDKKFFEFSDALRSVRLFSVKRFPRPWLYLKRTQVLFQEGRENQKNFKIVEDFMKFMLEEHMNLTSSQSDGCREKSITHILLEYQRKNPSFATEDIYQEIQTFIIAAISTTSVTFLWTLYLLGNHPEIQEKAFEEVQLVTGNSDEDISFDDLKELKYLENVIKESLRLYTTIPMFSRQLSREIEFGKYKIPKNTLVLFITYLMHKDSNIFPDPEKFDPDRFYEKSLNPWACVSFAEGVRSCIGKNFALIQLKILLANFVRNFKVTSAEKNIAAKWHVFLFPEHIPHFDFSDRRSHLLPQE